MLDNLEYGPGDLQAQKEAHAFKFADRVVVNFQCSIRLDIRDGECPVRFPKSYRIHLYFPVFRQKHFFKLAYQLILDLKLMISAPTMSRFKYEKKGTKKASIK